MQSTYFYLLDLSIFLNLNYCSMKINKLYVIKVKKELSIRLIYKITRKLIQNGIENVKIYKYTNYNQNGLIISNYYKKIKKMLDQTYSSEFQVQDIVDEKIIDNDVHYLVKWKGYGHQENTWEPKRHMVNCDEKMEKWQRYKEIIASKLQIDRSLHGSYKIKQKQKPDSIATKQSKIDQMIIENGFQKYVPKKKSKMDKMQRKKKQLQIFDRRLKARPKVWDQYLEGQDENIKKMTQKIKEVISQVYGIKSNSDKNGNHVDNQKLLNKNSLNNSSIVGKKTIQQPYKQGMQQKKSFSKSKKKLINNSIFSQDSSIQIEIVDNKGIQQGKIDRKQQENQKILDNKDQLVDNKYIILDTVKIPNVEVNKSITAPIKPPIKIRKSKGIDVSKMVIQTIRLTDELILKLKSNENKLQISGDEEILSSRQEEKCIQLKSSESFNNTLSSHKEHMQQKDQDRFEPKQHQDVIQEIKNDYNQNKDQNSVESIRLENYYVKQTSKSQPSKRQTKLNKSTGHQSVLENQISNSKSSEVQDSKNTKRQLPRIKKRSQIQNLYPKCQLPFQCSISTIQEFNSSILGWKSSDNSNPFSYCNPKQYNKMILDLDYKDCYQKQIRIQNNIQRNNNINYSSLTDHVSTANPLGMSEYNTLPDHNQISRIIVINQQSVSTKGTHSNEQQRNLELKNELSRSQYM